MSYSVILIDINNTINWTTYSKYLKANVKENLEIIYCSSKKITKKNITNYIFDKNENIEKIINTTVSNCTHENIIIVRDALRAEKIHLLIDKHKKDAQIISFKRTISKTKKFFFNIIKSIAQSIFGHKLLLMDYGIVLYGKTPTSVLKNIASPSVLTKTNSWSGIGFVLLEGGEKYKLSYSKKPHILKTIIPFFLGVILILLAVFAGIKMSAVLWIAYIGVIALIMFISSIFGFKWIVSTIIGENITEKAQILNLGGNKK